jgi:Transposase IS66 family
MSAIRIGAGPSHAAAAPPTGGRCRRPLGPMPGSAAGWRRPEQRPRPRWRTASPEPARRRPLGSCRDCGPGSHFQWPCQGCATAADPGRAAGELAYVHVACTPVPDPAAHRRAVCHRHRHWRGAAGYTGTIMRDGYAGYAHLVDALHAWCGAHSLRDLRAVWEADPAGQAGAMADLLVYANKAAGAARAAGARVLDGATLARIVGWYRGAAAKGIADNQRRRTQLAKDGLRLARRFGAHEAMILRFATLPSTSPTTRQNETSGRSRSSNEPRVAAGGPCKGWPTSPSCGPTCPLPPSGGWTSWRRCASCCHRALAAAGHRPRWFGYCREAAP